MPLLLLPYSSSVVVVVPTVVTNAPTAITSHGATFNGNITNTGGASVTERGFQFATTQNPDQIINALGSFSTGAYALSPTNLFNALTYYVRAYAVNSAGTGYGAWVSFTTLAGGYKVTINGIDRTADIINQTIQITDSINDKQTTCQFTLYDLHSLGIPTTGQEIIITLDSGTRIFAGFLITRRKYNKRGTLVLYDFTCVDYTYLLDERLVNKSYLGGQTDQAIIQDMINNFCQDSGITTMNVQLGVTIDMIAFNYEQPSKVMRMISDLTGRNWYIDYNKDLHYFPITQNPAPFNITDSQTYASGQGYWDLELTDDQSQLKNRVYVRGGTSLSTTTTASQKGDGTKKKFNLPDKPHSVVVTVNGVTKTLGTKNIDLSGFDYYLNYDEKYIEQDAGATVLGTSDTLQVSYTYDIPILVAVDNTTSIASQGLHEFLIVDKTITTTLAARARASAELTDYANNIVEGYFYTYTDGFRSGQYVNVNSAVLGITNTNYIIQKVVATSLGGGKFVYQVYLASAKTLGIIRFLVEMLQANKNLAQVATNEVLDNLVSLSDSLDPNSLSEVLTIDSAGPYRTWCKDSLEVTITRARWNLFEWR